MLKEVLETALLHCSRATDSYEEIQQEPLSIESFENKEVVKTIDAFIFRFVKLQDFMGEKLFKQLLKRIGEYKDNMSLLDVLDKLEKLELVPHADRWMDFRQVRNKLTHEYPSNRESIIDELKLAMKCFEEMKAILENIKQYLELRKLF